MPCLAVHKRASRRSERKRRSVAMHFPEDFWSVAQILAFRSLDNNFEIMSNLGRRANFIIPAKVERREFGVLLLDLWDDKMEIPAES